MPLTPADWGSNLGLASTNGDIAGLANGGFVVVGRTNGAATYEATIYNADASVRSGPTVLTQSNGTTPVPAPNFADGIKVVGLEDGGFAVHLLFESSSGVNSVAYGYDAAVSFDWFENISTTAGFSETNPEIAVGDGSVYVAVKSGAQTIRVERVDAETGVTRGGTDLNLPGNNPLFEPDVAYLGDDRVVVVYQLDPNGVGGTDADVGYQILDFSSGAPVVEFIGVQPGSANDIDGQPAVAALDDGGFAIAYRDLADGNSTDGQLLIARHAPDGTFLNATRITGADGANDVDIASNGEQFVVSWTEQGQTFTQRFNANNAPSAIGDERVIGGSLTSFSDTAVSFSADGRILTVGTFADLVGTGQSVSIFDSREGTQFIDETQGTAPAVGGIVVATDANRVLYGDDGNDRFLLNRRTTEVDGGAGIDTADFSAASGGLTAIGGLYLLPGTGIIELTSIERLIGTDSADDITTPTVSNVELAGGNDSFNAGTGASYVADGGSGSDTLGFVTFGAFEPVGVNVDLVLTGPQNFDPGSGRTLTITGFENMTGTDGTGADFDRLFGNDRGNVIEVRAGNDVVFGRGGSDTIDGGAGNDYLRTQEGNDIAYGQAGDDQLFGEAGNDRMFGGADNDKLFGGDGADVLFGEAGSDDLVGEGGNDRLVGGAGEDRLFGDAGNDVLEGGADIDRMFGGADNDVLIGGRGGDFLGGNAGADQFRYVSSTDSTATGGFDKITDFTRGQDKIDLRALGDLDGLAGGLQFTTGSFVSGNRGSVLYDGDFVRVDVNGTGTEDMLIRIFNTSTLGASDFLL